MVRDNPQNPGKEISQTLMVGVFPFPITGRWRRSPGLPSLQVSNIIQAERPGLTPGTHSEMGAPYKEEVNQGEKESNPFI